MPDITPDWAVEAPDWAQEAQPQARPSWSQAIGNIGSDISKTAEEIGALPGMVGKASAAAAYKATHDPAGFAKDVVMGPANLAISGGKALASGIADQARQVAGAVTAGQIGETKDEALARIDASQKAAIERPLTTVANIALSGLPSGELTAGQLALKGLTKGTGVADTYLGRPVNALLSGVSGEGQRLAQEAGERGGAIGRAFRANMAEPDYAGMQATGQQGIKGLKAERGSTYQQGIQDTANSKARLPYTDITTAANNGRALGFHGSFVKDPSVIEAMDAVDKAIAEHRVIPGTSIQATRRFPLEMDALKQRVGKILAEQPEGSAAQKAVLGVYDTIKGNIVKAVPTYSNVMDEYGDASKAITNAVSQLGLGRRATRGSAAGKLMSAMRDTGSATQITKGDALADVARHAPTLPYQIAGASMSPVLPRGIVARGGALLHGLEGAGTAGLLAHFLHPATIIPALMSSPRVVGNARYGIGAATRGARAVGATQQNIGRATEAARVAGLLADPERNQPRGLLNP